MVEEAKRDADGVLLVDAGDSLTGPQVLAAQKAPRARLILDTYRELGVEAMALGEKDRDAGVDLAPVRTGALVTRAGVRFGVLALDLEAHPGTRLEEVGAQAAALRKRGAQLVVALVHGGMQMVKGLLEPGGGGAGRIDIAVVSHSPWANARPERSGATWLVETPPQGKQAGRLDLHILDGKLDFVDFGEASEAAQRAHDLEQELLALGKRYADAQGAMADYYTRRKAELEGQRARLLEVSARAAAGKPPEGSWLENRLITLGTEIADAPAVAARIKKYKEQVGATGPLDTAHGGTAPMTGTATATAAVAAEAAAAARATALAAYAGIAACRPCHETQYQFWRSTKHAHAWDALRAKEQYKDPACVTCHVTGQSLTLPDVQCEACHGPGAAHVADKDRKGLILRSPSESMCTVCHRAPQAKEWEFTTFRAAVIGPGHGAAADAPRR